MTTTKTTTLWHVSKALLWLFFFIFLFVRFYIK